MLRYLDQDVLFDILLLCDIYTVITFTRVNSYYRRLALGKQLWVFLIRNLSVRGIVDLPADENFETYTTGDLIEEVKRVVVGPRAWAPDRDGESCATVRRRTVVHLGKPKNTYGKVSFLPGGRYFLASNWLEDGVWEVSTGRFVWGPQDACDRIYVDMLDGGDVAHFIHLCKHPLHPAIRVMRVHLPTSDSSELICLPYPANCPDVHRAEIHGDFFVLVFGTFSPPQLFIVNWRHETYALIKCSAPLLAGPGCLPGHIVVATHSKHWQDKIHTPQQLEIYSLASLTWRPLGLVQVLEGTPVFHWGDLIPQTVAPVVTERIALHNVCDWTGKLTVYKHPLHRDTYRVALYLQVESAPPAKKGLSGLLHSLRAPPEPRHHMLYKYNFSLPCANGSWPHGRREPAWRVVAAVPAMNFHSLHTLTFSGYAIQPSMSLSHQVVVDAQLARDGVEREQPREVSPQYKKRLDLDIGPYSAAVPLVSEDFSTLEILYFA